MADVKQIKKLREQSKAGVADCKRALEETDGNIEKAKALLKEWGVTKAAKKGGRATEAGLVDAYIHAGGSVGSLITLGCETDFVARTEEFKNLAHEIAMQVAAMDPNDVDELMKQAYIRDAKVTIEELVKQAIAKLGENITVKEFTRNEV